MYKALAIVAAILISLSAAFGGGYALRAAKCEADAVLIENAALKASNRATEASTKAIAKIRQTQTTIRQEVQREIIEKPVYRDCVHDDSVRVRIDSALSGQPSD